MLEKKFVVMDLRLSYNGPLSVEDFYKEAEDWAKEKGMHKNIRNHVDHVAGEGRDIVWTVEFWKPIAEWAQDVVRMKAHFYGVRDITVEIGGRKRKIQQAQVLLIFDGVVEANLRWRWEQHTIFYFLRNLFDKYVWIGTNPSERHFGLVFGDTHDLFKRMKAFFNVYKSRYV